MSDLLSPGLEPVVRSLARSGTLVVLDFDGTLAPIVGDRDAALLSRRSRDALERLARLYPVAVLSGRAAQDVRARLDEVAVRWVVGSHGAEWPGEEGQHQAWRRRVATWLEVLAGRLAGLAGVEVEVKPLSLAVHFRHCPDQRVAEARIREATMDLPGATIVSGKKVVNVLPREAGDKGTALRRLVKVAGAQRVLFVGDDVTDEAAFGASLEVPAVMVRVGRDPGSRASAWLRRRSDVDVLLERLSGLREVPGGGSSRRGRPRKATAERPPLAEVETLGSVLGFMKELWALEQGLNRRSKEMLSRHGMSGPQRLLVRVVARLGPISPARLARVLHLHPSSVSRLIRKLEARQVIRRTPFPGHRGRFLLELGPRGGRVERLEAGTVERAVKAALSSANAQEIAATRRVIALVTERLAGRS
jgi:trehalose 6-phosphate phosphatase